jgi:hypothetical protein
MRYTLTSRSIVASLKLLLAAITVWPLAATGSEQASPQSPDMFTTLVASVLAPPQPVLGDDDRIHIVYELFVTNTTASVIKLGAVEILAVASTTGDDQAQVLARLAGSDLDAAIKPLISGLALSIGPAQVSRIFLDLTREPGTPIPSALADPKRTLRRQPPQNKASLSAT